ncbi:hypothetical protein ACJJTC_000377 [Scirpophaga incertulas]
MAKQLAKVDIHAPDSPSDSDDDISVDLIDEKLYLGNLSCARDYKTLEKLQISHILTIDVVPLPRTILDRTNLNFRYVKLADVPKEDLITHLPETNQYIKQAISEGGTVLVHCYFGVSRSAAVVIAYIMEKYGLCYDEAFTLVKSKRRFIGPNVGFVAQLKLFGHMGYCINKDDPRFKQFRLKMAGQKLKQVKILPQQFADLIKPDPGLVRERPQPVVYRCRRCRRIVASQDNIIPHLPKEVKLELAKKGIRPPPSSLTGLTSQENGDLLIEKLKGLACQTDTDKNPGTSDDTGETEHLDGYHEENLVDAAVVARGSAAACRRAWFVEPMAWMCGVAQRPAGRLACPACRARLGAYCWLMGCKCPCGQKVAPAFYLVPSKVEWSNIVQNVQVTL